MKDKTASRLVLGEEITFPSLTRSQFDSFTLAVHMKWKKGETTLLNDIVTLSDKDIIIK